MKIAVAIDKWKLPVFDKHLKEAGYSYETESGISKEVLILKVEAEKELLRPIVKAANDECAKAGR
jgi:hypothetical protein